MSEYDVRLDILQIAADMGYKVNNWNGSMYIYNGKYKIYVVNAKTHRDPYSDPTISKDVEFDFVIKMERKMSQATTVWKEIDRKHIKTKTMYLQNHIPQYLEEFRQKGYLGITPNSLGIDLESELLKIRQKNIPAQDALREAFYLGVELGRKMN